MSLTLTCIQPCRSDWCFCGCPLTHRAFCPIFLLRLAFWLWKLAAIIEAVETIDQRKEYYTCFTMTSCAFPPSVVTMTGWCLVLWRLQQAQQPQKESRMRRRQERESNHCHQEQWGPQTKIIAILGRSHFSEGDSLGFRDVGLFKCHLHNTQYTCNGYLLLRNNCVTYQLSEVGSILVDKLLIKWVSSG